MKPQQKLIPWKHAVKAGETKLTQNQFCIAIICEIKTESLKFDAGEPEPYPNRNFYIALNRNGQRNFAEPAQELHFNRFDVLLFIMNKYSIKGIRQLSKNITLGNKFLFCFFIWIF